MVCSVSGSKMAMSAFLRDFRPSTSTSIRKSRSMSCTLMPYSPYSARATCCRTSSLPFSLTGLPVMKSMASSSASVSTGPAPSLTSPISPSSWLSGST